MTDEQTIDPQAAAAGAQEAAANAQFNMQRIYTKDISFEAPNTPQVFQEQGQLEMKMNLAQRLDSMGEGLHEVILTVTVTGLVNEKTAYLCEVQQAGIFQITGMNQQQEAGVINVLCPNTLYPYARATITQLVAAAGFPPLVLQPISFEQIYAQRMQEAQQQEAGAAATGDAE